MSNSQILGFYFVVFQTQFNGYVKCWIDGKEDWDYFSEEELLDKTLHLPDNYVLRQKLAQAFCESSFFLWDVDANTITRLSTKIKPESIKKGLLDIEKPLLQNEVVTHNNGFITMLKDTFSFLKK